MGTNDDGSSYSFYDNADLNDNSELLAGDKVCAVTKSYSLIGNTLTITCDTGVTLLSTGYSIVSGRPADGTFDPATLQARHEDVNSNTDMFSFNIGRSNRLIV